ncbi:MAG: transketolase family protein, partial [Spirochaetia bacterium]|nr:transketolase family protein [Spirochaetia bacterium]
PERSFNVGIAEQNMVSFAAGLAHEGFMPFVFSMAPFISMRACEQCRTDVAYSSLNVRLIATYAGYSGGISGATHWGLEDCAIMNSIAGMTVLEPSDPNQAKAMLEQSLSFKGPIYIRSSVCPIDLLYEPSFAYQLGKANILRDGDDGTFICSGVVVSFAVEASEYIRKTYNKQIRVVDMHTIKPIDVEAVIDASKTGRIIVAQDHSIIGGLGQIVATVIATGGYSVKLMILGCEDRFIPMAHANYLYQKYEYDAEGLIKNMLSLLEK